MVKNDIIAAQIVGYRRGIEDAIDMILMKSRAEADLASLGTEVKKLHKLHQLWSSQKKTQVDCEFKKGVTLEIKNLRYRRGTAAISVDALNLQRGKIYAVTGSNGCGKSTFFRILRACSTNTDSIPLSSSIQLDENAVHIRMPSREIVEITQNFYWPKFCSPLSWIQSSSNNATAVDIAKKLQFLHFDGLAYNKDEESSKNNLEKILGTRQHDWFSSLSGGQKSKVELVRRVLSGQTCPGIIFIDETLAPLDPSSKRTVMAQLKSECRRSLILVIYHADTQRDDTTSLHDTHVVDTRDCVQSQDFFDANIHFENGTVRYRNLCDNII